MGMALGNDLAALPVDLQEPGVAWMPIDLYGAPVVRPSRLKVRAIGVLFWRSTAVGVAMGALPSASGITSAAFFRIAAGCGFEGFHPSISWVETLCVVASRYLVSSCRGGRVGSRVSHLAAGRRL